MSIQHLFTTILLYPPFIILYYAYYFGFKLTCLIQYLFKIIYIEQLCGFKRKQKIIDSLNALSKKPHQVTLVYSIDHSSMLNDQSRIQENYLVKKIWEQQIQILNCIQSINQINIFINSLQMNTVLELVSQIRTKCQQKGINKVKIINQFKIQRLINEGKNHAPLVLIFSDYQEICNLPSKYLINAEIAFNSSIQTTTKFDLYKSFCQYADSKQRNGK